MPPISPTEQNWLRTAAGQPTQYAPGLTPNNAPNPVLGASTGPQLQAAPTQAQIDAQTQASADAKTKSQNALYLQDQAHQLQDLVGRLGVNRDSSLADNQNQYDTGVGTVNQQRDTQVTGQNKAKVSAYNTIDQNANTGYRSLAQIIGRASGTGSSAFRDLLPDVIGRDTSSKRQGATDTFGQNLSNIEASATNSIADLARQKKENERKVLEGYNTNFQNLQGQLSTNAGQLAQNNGGDFNAVKAAQQPFANAIANSRNTVEGFGSQYRSPFTPLAVDPSLAAYQTDRSTVNAQGQPGVDSSNPYASLLRKRLQGAA